MVTNKHQMTDRQWAVLSTIRAGGVLELTWTGFRLDGRDVDSSDVIVLKNFGLLERNTNPMPDADTFAQFRISNAGNDAYTVHHQWYMRPGSHVLN